MDPTKKDQRNVIVLFIVLITFFLCYKIYVDKKDKNSLRNAVTVVGEVKELQRTRGIIIVHVNFSYNGELIENQFETYDVDSLKVGTKVRLKVSPTNPKGVIEPVGVVNQ
jgi:hypothetical protein